MNNPFSGGWRFGGRPTSVEALYQPQQVNNDFLKKVAALAQDPAKQGLLDQAVTATPLQGLLDAPGSAGWGNEQGRDGGGRAQQAGGFVEGPDGNTYGQTSPGGVSFGFNPSQMMAGMLAMNPLAALASGVTMQQTPANYSLQYYGAPNMTMADALAMAAKANGGLIGDVSFGGGGDYGLGPGGSFGDYGSSLGGAAGLGMDANDIGDGFGFGGLGDW